jgi:hypothetical protein
MQFFYDGQIRRYLVQTIRVLSNFVVKYGDGSLVRVPVMYGDMDRQAASILRNNSENTVNSAPRIAVYITGLELDRDRLSDSTYVGKLHVRERDFDNNVNYVQGQGKNYTVERLMPTPFKLTMKADIWSTSTEQKLQILEQILVLFNPSLELQTTDNYIDWTSLSVLNLTSTSWSSRSVPSGADTPIDIATLSFETPIWISPPVKVKHLGVITNIITSIYESVTTSEDAYIEGLGQPLGGTTTTLAGLLSRQSVTIDDFGIAVQGNQVILISDIKHESRLASVDELTNYQGMSQPWDDIFARYPGKFTAGSTTIFLKQADGTEVVGTVAINLLDDTRLEVSWDKDTYPRTNGIDSAGLIDRIDVDYNGDDSYRHRSPGTFDAIINPLTKGPRGAGLLNPTASIRYLIIEDIGNIDNTDGAAAWKSNAGDDLVAHANDIIEWDGDQWNVIFDSVHKQDIIIYQTNIYTGIQYMWNGVSWIKSFEGEYLQGQWRIEL